MVKYFRKSFSLSDLWVSSNDKLSDFYASSWQRGDSAVPMLVARLVLAVAAVGILVWAVSEAPSPAWLLFLTNWGLVLITAMTLCGLTVSLYAVCSKIPDEGEMPWYMTMYWLLYNVAVTMAFVITALYWVLLYDPENEELNGRQFWLDVVTHGFNSSIVLVEVLLSRTPVWFLHLYQPLGMGVWYAVFTGIYYAAGGTDGNGNPFIYEVLDWRKLGQTSAIVGASAVGLVAIYTIVWGLALCRDKISIALVRTTSHNLPFTPPDAIEVV